MGRKISVKNRSAGSVVYSVPDMKIRRDFLPGEVKVIDSDELRQLSYRQGGRLIIAEYLQILDAPTREEINGPVEPEYNFGDEEVKQLILNGSLDSFLDALDFAPVGVIDMIKKYAVELPMADMNKMAAMKEKLGFDVRTAIDTQREDEGEAPATPKKQRRVSTTSTKKSSGRRSTKTASVSEQE